MAPGPLHWWTMAAVDDYVDRASDSAEIAALPTVVAGMSIVAVNYGSESSTGSDSMLSGCILWGKSVSGEL